MAGRTDAVRWGLSAAGMRPTGFATTGAVSPPARISSPSIRDDYCRSVESCNGGTKIRGASIVPVPLFSQPLRRQPGGRGGAKLPDVLATSAVDLGRRSFETVFLRSSRFLRVVTKVFAAMLLERRAASRAIPAMLGLACLLLPRSLCWQTKRTAFERSLGCLQHHFGSCLGQKDAPKARVAGRLGRSGRGFFVRSSASPGLPHLSSQVGLVPAARQR